MSVAKVAVITGGAGGMGLAVAQALATRGSWHIHILDVKADEGYKAADSLPNTLFHMVDLTQYDELAATFKLIFSSHGRIDFVHANAGIVERGSMYELMSDSIDPPPPPDYTSIEVNLKACVNTVHIARHFIQKSPDKGSIVITASCSSFWPTYTAPIYTASKFGVMGFMRSIATAYYLLDGIRVNALCPGAVRTPMVPEDIWDNFPEDVFTRLELIAQVVLQLADGEEVIDAKGNKVAGPQLYGQAIVANGKNFYFQDEPEYCDDVTARTINATRVENQAGFNSKK